MQDDLKERLRAMVTNRPDSLGICTSWHRNPDGPEAADRIEALEAENERLRGALGLIIENEGPDTGYGNSSAKIALAALGDWKSEAGDLGGDHVR